MSNCDVGEADLGSDKKVVARRERANERLE